MDALIDQISTLSQELINYGPYALLALFLLIIAPKHTKRFIECQETDKTKRRLLCTIASANWLVVFVMCTYIYINWSPVTAYQGTLGAHGEESVFYSSDSNSYITTNGAHNNKLEWVFAYITDGGVVKQEDRFRFTHEYKKVNTDFPMYADYSIQASTLKKGKMRITRNSTDPAKLMIDADNDPETAPTLLKPDTLYQALNHSGGFMAAYAAPAPADNATIIRQLSSSNRHFQAAGRRSLQSKPIQELRLMLQTPNISAKVKQQIQTVISSR